MRKSNLYILAILILSVTILISCKKDKKDDTTPTVESKPNDQQGASAADDAIDNVNDFINNKIGGGSTYKVGAYNLPCGVVSVDSSTTNGSGKKIYKMNYGSQTPCGYKKISGEVSFSLSNGATYDVAGAVYTITFTNYTVEANANGNQVTLNGTLTVTNVNGGYIWQAVTMSSTIVHRLRGTFSITHSDNTIRNRSFYQLRTFASSNGWAGLSLTVAGDTTINGVNVSQIGRTYQGDYYFEMQILNNYVWSNCGTTYAGPYVLKSGKAKLDVTIPLVSPAYIEVEGGYYWNYSTGSTTATLVNDCTTNAYKITTVIGSATTTNYQLY